MSGEAYLRNILGITDHEVLDAVRYHTTAKKNMSLTAKILYLADFTSADRDYEDVEVHGFYKDYVLDKKVNNFHLSKHDSEILVYQGFSSKNIGKSN